MFTARYGLIPYIQQITFRLQKVNVVRYLTLGAVLPECTQYIATDTKGKVTQLLKVQL